MRFFTIILIVLLFSCNGRKDELIVPKWEMGDIRTITVKSYTFMKVKNDTILNITGDFSYKIHVISKTSDSYILEISDRSKPNMEFANGNDTITNQLKTIIHVCDQIPMDGFSYNVRTSKNGEIIGIDNWKQVRDTLISITMKFVNTYTMTSDEKQYMQKYTESKYSKKEDLSAFLLNQISDIFVLYNTKIPADSAITSDVQFPDPKTGMTVMTKQTCKLVSVNENLYVFEVVIDLNNDLFLSRDEKVNNFFNKDSVKNINMNIDNKSLYYWDSNTGWFDSLNIFFQIKSDSFYWTMKEDIHLNK